MIGLIYRTMLLIINFELTFTLILPICKLVPLLFAFKFGLVFVLAMSFTTFLRLLCYLLCSLLPLNTWCCYLLSSLFSSLANSCLIFNFNVWISSMGLHFFYFSLVIFLTVGVAPRDWRIGNWFFTIVAEPYFISVISSKSFFISCILKTSSLFWNVLVSLIYSTNGQTSLDSELFSDF